MCCVVLCYRLIWLASCFQTPGCIGNVSVLHLVIVKEHSMVVIEPIDFICLSVNGWWFLLFGYCDHTAVTMFLCGLAVIYFTCGVELLGDRVTVFNLLKNCQTVFKSSCTIFTFQQCLRDPVSLHTLQHVLLSNTLITAILPSVKWCFTVALLSVFLRANNTEHLSCAFWPFICLLWRKCELFIYSSPLLETWFAIFLPSYGFLYSWWCPLKEELLLLMMLVMFVIVVACDFGVP